MKFAELKFSPVLALYGAGFVAAAVVAYLFYKDASGLAGEIAAPVKQWWNGLDSNALAGGQTAAAALIQPKLTYLQARAVWFKQQGLSGSAAIQRAEQSDFPQLAQWEAGVPFPPK